MGGVLHWFVSCVGAFYGLWFAGLGVLQWFLGWICLGFVDVGFCCLTRFEVLGLSNIVCFVWGVGCLGGFGLVGCVVCGWCRFAGLVSEVFSRWVWCLVCWLVAVLVVILWWLAVVFSGCTWVSEFLWFGII